MEIVREFFQQNMALSLGIFCVLVGGFMLLAAIKNWKLIFGDVSRVTYNLEKIDGIVNMFGRKTARVVSGIGSGVLVLLGILLIVLSFME